MEGYFTNKPKKNERIASTRQQTIARHRTMTCKTYELKVDRSHLSKETLDKLKLLFLEAKWFYNTFVAAMRSGDTNFDYKSNEAIVKKRDGEFEARSINNLSSQMRQEIIDRAKDNLKGLRRMKEKGCRAGMLRFTSRVTSIPLKQHGVTYRINRRRIRIQGIKQTLRVRGTEQIPQEAELTSATLISLGRDYFVHVTTYQPTQQTVNFQRKAIGVDTGVRRQLTLSNGVTVKIDVPLTKRLRRLHRELSRRRPGGRNRSETNNNLTRESDKINNSKLDIRHKLVSYLTRNYSCIATQKDNVAAWQRLWGRRVLSSAIGGIMSDLRSKPHTRVVVDRFAPTTKKCCLCGSINETGLAERFYSCRACGLMLDRDLNAAINIWSQIPAERRESTPGDTKAAMEMARYFNGIPHVSASLVEEPGSQPNLVGGSSRIGQK